ncbi:UNVERIFIED_CONTAM: B2 protein [Sesamum calycinum]|uniref:B2 protein n=1 Tax=Sesamum calycinum TaxID=2727403 RepID=A0AAW2M275_9LAMI
MDLFFSLPDDARARMVRLMLDGLATKLMLTNRRSDRLFRLGGSYIENLLYPAERHGLGLPPRYHDSVRAITPGLPLFLYYSTHQLHGIFEAARFGGTNVDPSIWEDKKNPGNLSKAAQGACLSLGAAQLAAEDAAVPKLSDEPEALD